MSEPLQYQFLPYLRQGMSARLNKDAEGPRATTTVTVDVKGYQDQAAAASASVVQTISLYGPGDLTGFDAKIVARTNPRPHVGDFESNLFPHVEFVDPDFPWRFTPGAPQAGHQLLPWISLIVLRVDSSTESTAKETQTEILEEGVSPERRTPWVRVHGRALPDFREAWRWAHVQVAEIPDDPENTLNFDSPQEVGKQLEDNPARAVARLLCHRVLRPKTRYRALVVPTFEIGRQAGLEHVSDPHLSGMIPIDHTSDEVWLPYYYQWEFGTGSRGDFENLVRRLEPRRLTDLGRRTIHVAQPGYDLPGAGPSADPELQPNELAMEGALQSLDAVSTPWGTDSIFQVRIKKQSLGRRSSWFVTWRTLVPMSATVFYKTLPKVPRQEPILEKQVATSRLATNHLVKLPGSLQSPFAFRILCEDAQGGRVQVEGRYPWDESTRPLAHDTTPGGHTFRTQLADTVLNRQETPPVGTPLVGPPVYGQWQARRDTLDPSKATWLDTLNLDPRHRAAAGIGAQVIREHQEALMSEAWEQAGEIEEANQLIRHAQLASELSVSAMNRVKKAFKTEKMTPELLQWAAPAFPRVWHKPEGSVQPPSSPQSTLLTHYLHASQSLVPRVLDTAFVRMARVRGPIRKRQGITKIIPASKKKPALPSLTNNRFYAVAPAHSSSTLAQLIQVGQQPVSRTTTGNAAVSTSRTHQRGPSVETPLGPRPLPGRRPTPGTKPTTPTETVAIDLVRMWMKGTRRYPTVKSPATPVITVQTIRQTMLKHLNPVTVIPQQINRRLMVEGPARQKPMDVILAAPRFSQAMYEPLMELDQNWVLPGVENVPQNTLAILKPNRRFIEAYLCGVNHEWMRELIWREYPTDQRGTSFRQFWDVQDAVPTGNEPPMPEVQKKYLAQQLGKKKENLDDHELWAERLHDILPLSEWKERGLGGQANIWGGKRSQPGTSATEQLVLLIRGDLINKYPNTVVYAVEARKTTDGEGKPVRRPALPEYFDSIEEASPIFPIFSAHLPQDMLFLGFPFSEEQARTGKSLSGTADSYFFVLEERVSETRFGLDLSNAEPPADLQNWRDLTWSHFSGIRADDYLNATAPTDPIGNQPGFEPEPDPTIDDKQWSKSAAAVAAITLQGPFRVAIHATQMLPRREA